MDISVASSLNELEKTFSVLEQSNEPEINGLYLLYYLIFYLKLFSFFYLVRLD